MSDDDFVVQYVTNIDPDDRPNAIGYVILIVLAAAVLLMVVLAFSA